jgi:hypothetical protein
MIGQTILHSRIIEKLGGGGVELQKTSSRSPAATICNLTGQQSPHIMCRTFWDTSTPFSVAQNLVSAWLYALIEN